MRVFLLVLLLILNVFAEAKGSGSAQGGKSTKKAKTTVVEKAKNPAQKSKSKRKTTISSSSSAFSSSSEAELQDSLSYAVESSSSVAVDSTVDVAIVRDTIVDTVYVVFPDTAGKKRKKSYNIPLPHQSAYLGEGLSVGIGAGLLNPSKECDCLGVWQGQFEYHYKKYITGGLDVRFFGGTLDRDVMLMYQRYRLNARLHKRFLGADYYVSAILGLETTDLSEFRKELREGIRKKHSDNSDSSSVVETSARVAMLKDDPSDGDSDDESEEESEEGSTVDSLANERNCEKMFSLDGFTLGFEFGMGVVLSKYIGVVGSASYEFNLSWAQLVTFTPGIAFNLREVWPWAGRNLRSTWISFELVFQRYFNRNVNEWAIAGFVGLQFGI